VHAWKHQARADPLFEFRDQRLLPLASGIFASVMGFMSFANSRTIEFVNPVPAFPA
jgi:hypothetical protein